MENWTDREKALQSQSDERLAMFISLNQKIGDLERRIRKIERDIEEEEAKREAALFEEAARRG